MLTPCSILFYLYCDWKHFSPTYRVYFNDELMTEREYIWDNKHHILQEHIPVTIDVTVPHTVRIQAIRPLSGTFRVQGLVATPGARVFVEIV
jgi:hypothetical protein